MLVHQRVTPLPDIGWQAHTVTPCNPTHPLGDDFMLSGKMPSKTRRVWWSSGPHCWMPGFDPGDPVEHCHWTWGYMRAEPWNILKYLEILWMLPSFLDAQTIPNHFPHEVATSVMQQFVQSFAALTCTCCFISSKPPGRPSQKKAMCLQCGA